MTTILTHGDNGRLSSIINKKNSHSLYINYIDTSQKIDYVKDKADNRIDFIYNADNSRIKSTELQLKQSDGSYKVVEEKEYVFDSYNNLDSIIQGFNYGTNSTSTMKYNHQLEYEFDSDNKLINAYNTTNDYKIEYQYDINNKVEIVKTSDSSKLLGELNVNYEFQKTTYTDHEGSSVYYTFDHYGHSVNIMDDFGYSSFYKYSGLFTWIDEYYYDHENEFDFMNTPPNYLNNHQLLYDSSVFNQKQQQNPVNNHGFENGVNGWTLYPDTSGNIGTSDNESMLGTSSLYIQSSSDYASQSLDLKYGTYTLVAWIKNDSNTSGAYIDVLQADYKYPNPIQKIYNTDGKWVKYYLQFTLKTSKIVTINLINESNSIAYFDNVQIVNGFVDVRYNEVTNSSFENGPDNWTVNRAGQTPLSDYGNYNPELMENILGNKAMFVMGDGSHRGYFEQDISHLVTEGETFVVAGWAKADAVPNKATLTNEEPYDSITRFETNSDGRFFGLEVEIDYEDEGYNLTLIKKLTFDPSISDWQFQMRTFELPGTVKNVKIRGVYQGEGYAYFDNIQLYHDELGTNFGYDDRGNLTSVESKGESTSIVYDENDDAKEVTTDGVTTDIARNTNKQIEEILRNNVKTTFEYDSQTNQLIYTYVGYDKNKTTQEKWFKTSTIYTTDNQYVQSVKDEFGNVNSTETDYATSLIKSITDAMGNTQTFSYDEYGNLDYTVLYTSDLDSANVDYDYYEDGKLWKINRDGCIYEFKYNDLDQMKNVLINGTIVMTYEYLEYTDDNGNIYYTDLIEKQIYGYDAQVDDDIFFTYNDEYQVTQVKFNGVIRSEYEYDSSGRLAIYKDVHNGNIYFYSYDLTGRIETVTDKDGNKINYSYDDDGNVDNYSYEISNNSREVKYRYNQTTGEYDYTYYYINGTSIYKRYNYDEDSLRRLNNIELSIGATDFTKQFIYDDNKVNPSMGNATNRVYQVIYKKDNDIQETYEYTYDANQNITMIKIESASGKLLEQYNYTYDGFNQLIREDVLIVDNKSFTKTYAYDQRGNITNIKEYNYTLNENITGTALTEKVLSYYQGKWQDQVTSIGYYENGSYIYHQTYAYDDSGNVTQISDSRSPYSTNFSWDGRQLTSTGGYCHSFSYKYNDQGIRTEKKISTCGGSTTTNYVVNGDKVLVEDDGSNVIYYTYDVDGSLLSMNLNDAEYFYITNLQGDIIELVDINGYTRVTYKYDAWGNIIDTKEYDSQGNETTLNIANKNPYRYRGYRYDEETGWYYLNSRYYNPGIGRFINADGLLGPQGDILGHNMCAPR